MSQAKQTQAHAPAPLVEVRRGAITESRHRGHVVAVDGDGRVVARLGAPEMITYLRSSAKRERGEPFRVLQNNCSGKHAGLLALALHLGAPIETYDNLDNPVQQAIAETVAQFADVARAELAIGVDGCGVPVFGVPVEAMALMYARLVAPPIDFAETTRAACQRIVEAVTTYPELVGGAGERLDTEVMRATRGRVVSKIGAEGVYTAGVRPSAQWPRGLGLALKIEDGENLRARPTVVIESLRQLGVLDEAAHAALAPYARFDVRNHRGELVGEVRAAFELEKF